MCNLVSGGLGEPFQVSVACSTAGDKPLASDLLVASCSPRCLTVAVGLQTWRQEGIFHSGSLVRAAGECLVVRAFIFFLSFFFLVMFVLPT